MSTRTLPSPSNPGDAKMRGKHCLNRWGATELTTLRRRSYKEVTFRWSTASTFLLVSHVWRPTVAQKLIDVLHDGYDPLDAPINVEVHQQLGGALHLQKDNTMTLRLWYAAQLQLSTTVLWARGV
eukprot:715853-Amphidinium_carterae.2